MNVNVIDTKGLMDMTPVVVSDNLEMTLNHLVVMETEEVPFFLRSKKNLSKFNIDCERVKNVFSKLASSSGCVGVIFELIRCKLNGITLNDHTVESGFSSNGQYIYSGLNFELRYIDRKHSNIYEFIVNVDKESKVDLHFTLKNLSGEFNHTLNFHDMWKDPKNSFEECSEFIEKLISTYNYKYLSAPAFEVDDRLQEDFPQSSKVVSPLS